MSGQAPASPDRGPGREAGREVGREAESDGLALIGVTSPLRRRAVIRRQWPLMVWLVFVWVALWGDLSAANVLGGLALALIIRLAFPMPVFPAQFRLRPLALGILLGRFTWDLVIASFNVAWLAFRPGPVPAVAVLRVPVRSRSEAVLTVVAELTCLVPGSVVLETHPAQRVMYVHTLGLSTEADFEKFRQDTLALEQRVIRAFSRDTDEPPQHTPTQQKEAGG